MATCGDTNHPVCYASPDPSKDLCCETDRKCLVTAANTTVICCPEDGECLNISTIDCDINQLRSGNDIMTTVFDVPLPRCGRDCCPFGYHCESFGSSPPVDSHECFLDDDYNDFPPAKSSGSADTPTDTPTESPTESPTTSPTLSTTSQDGSIVTVTVAPEPQSSQAVESPTGLSLSTGEIAGIAVGGAFGIAFIVLLLYLIRRIHQSIKARKEDQPSQDVSSPGELDASSTNNPKAADNQLVEAHSNVIYELGA